MTRSFSELLEEHGLSGKALADKAELDYNTVWRLTASVSDQTNIRISTFVKIANALDLELTELADELGVEGVRVHDAENMDREQRELARIYKRLEPERQNALLEVARALRMRDLSIRAMREADEDEVVEDEEDVQE